VLRERREVMRYKYTTKVEDALRGLAEMGYEMTTATTIYELSKEVSPRDIYTTVTNDHNQISYILEGIADYEIEDEQDDSLFELCDSLVDVYTKDLYDWMDESFEHKGYVEEAVNSGLVDTKNFDLDRAIMAGQYEWYQEMARDVIEVLQEKLEEIELEREEEEDDE
jgi:hypothetical protein